MSDFMQAVEDGEKGLNKGLPNAFNRFNAYMNNTQQGIYYLIGALSGVGKTAFTDSNFVLEPFLRHQGVKIKWLYYSFEISMKVKKAKWIAYMIYKKFNVATDPNVILSRGTHRITPEIKAMVKDVLPEVERLFSQIKFVDEQQTPNQIYRDLMMYAVANGTFTYEKYKDSHGIEHERKSGYIPNDPKEFVIPIIDHMGLVKGEKGLSKKQSIDKLSSMLVWFRNMCNYSPVAVSQFNRSLASVDRQKFKASDLSPGAEDFKDTGNMIEDCNVGIGLFSPFQFDIKEYLGYDITKLPRNFRAVNILKNREGESDKTIGMQFGGGPGIFAELPRANELDGILNDYSNYII
jgi:hypothetical protein